MHIHICKRRMQELRKGGGIKGVLRENGISARGFLARGILTLICARIPRVRNPRAENKSPFLI